MFEHNLPTTGNILIAGNQFHVAKTIESYLVKSGYKAVIAANAKAATSLNRQERFDLVVADLDMPDEQAFELLDSLREYDGNARVIMITAQGAVEKSTQAIRRGASECMSWPFELKEFTIIVKTLLARRQIAENNSGKAQLNNNHAKNIESVLINNGLRSAPTTRLIGHSEVIGKLKELITRIAPTDSSVLITGATGTGKELVARAIHDQSLQRNKPFIDINCSAIPDTLFEAELFGHQRGSFTGANETRRGLFEEANGGTIFLDEVDTLSLSAQTKLLRVLQERQVRRVGGRENISINVRIIAATGCDLQAAVADGRFRRDLLFRLRVVPIYISELRERREDIPLLIEHFLQRYLKTNVHPRYFSDEAINRLMSYSWPGNVRELENAIEHALAVGSDYQLGVDDLPLEVLQGGSNTGEILNFCSTKLAPLAEVERRYILYMFEHCGRHHIKTAQVLGISRRTLYRKLVEYGEKAVA